MIAAILLSYHIFTVKLGVSVGYIDKLGALNGQKLAQSRFGSVPVHSTDLCECFVQNVSAEAYSMRNSCGPTFGRLQKCLET